MRPLHSLRSRLLLGAALWTIGLFLAGVLITTLIFLQFGHWPRIMHAASISYSTWFILTTTACLIGGLLAFRSGMSPLGQLRARLSGVHAGRERRVDGNYPSEVEPLVNDLNALLEHRDQMVGRALAKAGDLAHGLKTPLAVLAQEAERAEAQGHHDVAATIGQQVERMRRQIEYHLAHARAAASGATPGARCPVLVSAQGLSRTLQQLYVGRSLVIDLKISPDHAVRGQREDLDEMLGNLLDNACKWAASTIVVESAASNGSIVITVDDDGRGLEESKREVVLQRGVRADEAAPGSGFGLAIVRDLVEVYGGSISLSESPAGGLRARLTLPGCQ